MATETFGEMMRRARLAAERDALRAQSHSARYRAYLASDLWAERARAAKERADWRCERCGNPEGLAVHHVTYVRLGHERDEDLEVLCPDCHDEADEQRARRRRRRRLAWD